MKLLWKMQFPVKYASHTHRRTLNLLNEMIIHIIIVKVFLVWTEQPRLHTLAVQIYCINKYVEQFDVTMDWDDRPTTHEWYFIVESIYIKPLQIKYDMRNGWILLSNSINGQRPRRGFGFTIDLSVDGIMIAKGTSFLCRECRVFVFRSNPVKNPRTKCDQKYILEITSFTPWKYPPMGMS